MRGLQWLAISLVAPAYFLGTKAFIRPCVYQSDKCGFTLMAVYGYNISELTAAVNQTPSIPPLDIPQLTQVIYRCDDILGNITGNTYCINGCVPAPSLTEDDQCSAAPNGTCPPGGCSPVFIKQCQTICIGDNCTEISVSETVMPRTVAPVSAAPLITAF